MPRRLTNDLLIGLVLAQVLTGLLGWAIAVEAARPLYDLHRALGIAVVLLLGWKQAIALGSLRKRGTRDGSIVWGATAAIALLVTLAIGLAWTLNGISWDLLWGYSPLNVHVILGIALLPFVGWHMLARRRPNGQSAPVASRRALVRVGGLGLATVVGWQAIERLAPAARRPTGSKAAGSFNANAFPSQIWLFDQVPILNGVDWRLTIADQRFSLQDLTAMHPRADIQAVLDCTSGWWSEQIWSGVWLRDVLQTAHLQASNIAVVSLTGHRIVLDTDDLRSALLATHVGGQVLEPAHGYPVRLVVPGKRGYHWVKWVTAITPV